MGNWKIYIWRKIEEVSNNYHTEGGIVVIAQSEQRAREIANSKEYCNIKDNEKIDDVYQLSANVEEDIIIFPDAGCC